ncbi:uncharacterized protein EV422DRAFT_511385 [Fimicolochytrium jonesii]|uniref:uncharacterized protein n=1 Tax=Fimicolochytrium jonesii TaxID=1396493 RepID=UPI0022FE4C5D|nr:uncharacterized protein EV422DRAFT_511385 [Fimicolochytrium jonesii]KAI8826771.1 hypothetical protein EV422DRAFT_511385 [Fimicolochytrium jonesii]
MYTPVTPVFQPRVLRPSTTHNTPSRTIPERPSSPSVPQFESETSMYDRGIAMPAPQKPFLLRTLQHNMLVPRLDTYSPSLEKSYSGGGGGAGGEGIQQNSSVVPRQQQKRGPAARVSIRRYNSPLSPLKENTETDDFYSGEDAAVAELMEIMGMQPLRRNIVEDDDEQEENEEDENNPPPPTKRRPGGHTRKSSVPALFQPHDTDPTPTTTLTPQHPSLAILQPPRLASTPFRPVPTTPPPADRSPVSRSKNPLPFNAPFLNRYRAPSPLVSSPQQQLDFTFATGAELGLLSPSPDHTRVVGNGNGNGNGNATGVGPYQQQQRPMNPMVNRMVDIVCANVGGSVRPRSKSVTDLDGGIRLAFAC